MEIKTDSIEDATIVSETKGTEQANNASEGLLERAKKLTAFKNPGTASAPVSKPENKATKSSFWSQSDDDFEQPKKSAEPEKAKESEKENKQESGAQSPGDKKITDRAKEGSARTAVGMVELTQGMLLKPWINYKFKKKFSPEDIELLSEKVADAQIKELEGKELALRTKWDKLMSKRDKLMDRVPLDPTEKKDLTEAFYNYFDITQKNMPPEWYLAFALINVTGNRVIDIAFD